MGYLLTKTAHLVFVIAWMSTVFYLPRILVNIAEAGDAGSGEGSAVRARLVLMGRRLYRKPTTADRDASSLRSRRRRRLCGPWFGRQFVR